MSKIIPCMFTIVNEMAIYLFRVSNILLLETTEYTLVSLQIILTSTF